MRKILLAALAVLMIITLFSGCQLAVEGEGYEGEDMLCGMFITLDYVKTEIPEESIELPQNWNGDPSNIVFPKTRIYAKRDDNDKRFTDFRFDVEGIHFFTVQVEDTNGSYTTNISDPQIQEGCINVVNSDRYLTGTIYFDVNYPCRIYTNPVYQTPDGDVYMIPGSCMDYGNLLTEGSGGSTKLSATNTTTIDGEKTSRTVEVEIKIEGVNSNKKVVLKQMDSDDQTIAEEAIIKDNIPDSIAVLRDTQYMIMEEHCNNNEGEKIIKRTLLDMEEETLDVRFTGDRGIVETSYVSLKKPE